MKLTIIGGGGVRTPLFVRSVLRRADIFHFDEICLMDIDQPKLQVISGLCKEIVLSAGSDIQITETNVPSKAMDGAQYVVTTIRVGAEPGRVKDERIALKHNVLGQETTGPGGFAMALRNIPVILDYAELLNKLNPEAWLFNFTNPAGLVVQALHDRGYKRVIGICDGANLGQDSVAKFLCVPKKHIRAEIFGLNHLSWGRQMELNGKDVLPSLLMEEDFLTSSHLNIFERELINNIGMWINEYLYYYYYREKALESILSEKSTRGEEILELNRQLFEQMEDIGIAHNPVKALSTYYHYQQRRNSTYMHYARPNTPNKIEADSIFDSLPFNSNFQDEGEGYAGVALDIIQAFETESQIITALNVPNEGSIPCMDKDDVVEVSCRVSGKMIRPLPIGKIPEHQELLMRSVKSYEKLTVQAILSGSRQKAVMAMMAHPLVMSYSLASILVDEYLSAHKEFIGNWK